MNYQEIVEWLAKDIINATEEKTDVESNVDRYMEDLTSAVQEKALTLVGLPSD